MKNTIVICLIAILLVVLFFIGTVKAQTGQVVFLGATSGTTLAANCPATPTTPSVCVVGDGMWVWQSSTTGWFKPVPAAAPVAGVQKVNGVAPGTTGNVTVSCADSAPVATVTGTAVSSTTTLNQLSTPSVTVTAPVTTCTATGS